jgi:F-type H+-transporting ATPase subunit gamma
VAGGQERALRRRIRSVQSTQKITKAMELIAASRIVRAQQRVQAARPYSEQILHVLHNLSSGGAASVNPLLQVLRDDEVRAVEYVVMAGDRGLCGGFNSGNIRTAELAINRERAFGRDVVLVTVGKKAESYFRFRKYAIAAAINGVMDRPTFEDARRVAAEVLPRFAAGSVQRVQVVYTEFLSAGSQRVVDRRLLPLDAEAIGLTGEQEQRDGPAADYEYEPEPTEILDALLPRYVEARLFGALLSSSASFFAAQQRAMAAASENAEELITKLTRLRNRARQDAITTEIMEIVGGAEALSQR